MNKNRTRMLREGFGKVRSAFAISLWFATIAVSLPPLVVLYWADIVMNWCEKHFPEVFGDDR